LPDALRAFCKTPAGRAGNSIAARKFCRKRFIDGIIEEKTENGIRKNLGLSQDFSNVVCDPFMVAFTCLYLTMLEAGIRSLLCCLFYPAAEHK
jgi:hypothetical protein